MKVQCVATSALSLIVNGAEVVAAPGQTIDVPAELAGRVPSDRLEPAMRELAEATGAHDHHRAAALREEIIGLDFGAGLLAQPSNWAPVKARTTTPKDGE